MKTSEMNRYGNRRYGRLEQYNDGPTQHRNYTVTVGGGVGGWFFHKLWRRGWRHRIWLAKPDLEVIGRDRTIVNEVYTVLEEDQDILKWLYENANSPCTIYYSNMKGMDTTRGNLIPWIKTDAAVYFRSKRDAMLYKLSFGGRYEQRI